MQLLEVLDTCERLQSVFCLLRYVFIHRFLTATCILKGLLTRVETYCIVKVNGKLKEFYILIFAARSLKAVKVTATFIAFQQLNLSFAVCEFVF